MKEVKQGESARRNVRRKKVKRGRKERKVRGGKNMGKKTTNERSKRGGMSE